MKSDIIETRLSNRVTVMRRVYLEAREGAVYRHTYEYVPVPYKWKSEAERANSVRRLINESASGSPFMLIPDTFKNRGFSWVFNYYFNGRTYVALQAAGYDIEPWETGEKPAPGYFGNKEKRNKAIQWYVEKKLRGDPKKLRHTELKHSLLSSMVGYDGNLFQLISDAGYRIKQWNMMFGTNRYLEYFKKEENRIDAVRYVVEEKAGGDPRNLNYKCLEEAGLAKLFKNFYHGNSWKAVREAGYDTEPWEMANAAPAGYYDNVEKRHKALLHIRNMALMEGREMPTRKMFLKYGFWGVLKHYNGNIPAAMADSLASTERRQETKARKDKSSNKLLRTEIEARIPNDVAKCINGHTTPKLRNIA